MDTHIQRAGRKISLDHIGIYLVACLDLFLILGVIVGRNDFLYSVFVPISLIAIIAMLATILIVRFSSDKKSNFNSRYIIAAIVLEAVLLFGLPLRLLPTLRFMILQTFIVLAIQFSAAFFFSRAFKGELTPLFGFFSLAGKLASQNALSQLSKITPSSPFGNPEKKDRKQPRLQPS